MPADLTAATSLTSMVHAADGAGRWATELDPRWQGNFGFFGGYVAAILTRALETVGATSDQSPLTVSVSFLERPQPGAAEVVTTVERAGSSLTSVTASLVQEGRQVARAHGAVAAPRHGPAFVDRRMPQVAPPQDCAPWRPDEWHHLPILDRYELRAALNGEPFAGLDVVETAGWARMSEPTALDASLIAFLADAFMPPIMARETRRLIAPTIELQLTFRVPLPADPGPDAWYLAHLSSEFAAGGYLEQSGTVWSQDGCLLARMRHLNLVRYIE